jgi:type II pantothenate kinase
MSDERDRTSRVGIDAGATLWKLARQGADWELAFLPAGAVGEIVRRLADWQPEAVHLTGGGAARIAAEIGGQVRQVSEFDAWVRGAVLLAARAGWTLPRRYLLVSLGTGTSILEVDGEAAARVSGLTLGGGTLSGLAKLLCGTDSFTELAALAERGERGRVDLRVGDIYPEGGIPLDPAITAASFAKAANLASGEAADVAQALVGLLGENVGVSTGALARAKGIETVLYGGSAIAASPLLGELLRLATQVGGAEAWLLEDGAFCGAVGAAALD